MLSQALGLYSCTQFEKVLIPQFIVVYSSEKITKIGQYLPELSQK